ncbi:MAG: AMP-binding protein, partial [bacterium]|nr:AMP-binding protein [bacterium]
PAPSAVKIKLYKTGDLARWLPDGNIEFLGRIDHQVKVRGFRIELGEIENQLLRHPGIKEAVVLSPVSQGKEISLAAYIVADKGLSLMEVKEFLSASLPDYMVPPYIMILGQMPLSPSGKVDRESLPVPDMMPGSSRYTPPRDKIEEKLVTIWSEVLHIAPESVGIDDNFFELGGHSLNGTLVISRIKKDLDVKIPLAEIFTATSIKKLADSVRDAEIDKYESIEPVEKRDYYPLSSAQKRLFFLETLAETRTGYNISNILWINGEFDLPCYDSTFRKLIGRHEALRTSFHQVGSRTFQKVHHEVPFKIEYISPRSGEESEKQYEPLIRDFIRPFDLSKAPLLRVGVVRQSPVRHLLMVDMHHIVSDGTSHELLMDDFASIFEGEELPPLRIQYKDFSLWQNRLFEGRRIKEQEAYWLEIFSPGTPIPRLNLPTDYQRPVVFNFKGDSHPFRLEGADAQRFRQLGTGRGVTLYINLLTALNVLLHKYTGQEDIIIGTGTMGRSHADLQRIIGIFINSLAMRNRPRSRKNYLELLWEIKNSSIHAFENQDFQLEELVNRLDLERDLSRNPLFDVVMVVQNFQRSQRRITGVTLEPYPAGNDISKFDLTLYVYEGEEDIFFDLEYCTALFKEETILRISAHLLAVIRAVCENPRIDISQIDILSPGERNQLLNEFNRATSDYPVDKTIHQLLQEQVDRTPDRIALVGPVLQDNNPVVSITYKELNEQSHRLALLLTGYGVQPDTIVGIMVERS